MNIAIIGGNGFIGRSIFNFFVKKKIKIAKILRNSKFKDFINNSDIIIHSANSGSKFEAENNKENDYKNSVQLTKKIFDVFKNKKIILISTISSRMESNIYSRNRYECEKIILQNSSNLVIRLPLMFNPINKRGILYDLVMNKKIYCGKNTNINSVTRSTISYEVYDNIFNNNIIEIGNYNRKNLLFLSNELNSKSTFEGPDKNFIIDNNIVNKKYDINKVIKLLKIYKRLNKV